jgi:2-polyprenyl-3-methyl-5-hydroxy-6-metoxy-1,4-benzoquinol methylase
MWYLPENLKKTEEKIYNLKVSEVVNTNDFGSYKIFLETGDINKSWLNAHNDIAPKNKILSIKSIIRNKIDKHFIPNKILNVGCGAGFETKELSLQYNCHVLGIDASKDGIEIAKRINSNKWTTFQTILIDENFSQTKKYDICFAIEFYPFTRSKDMKFQLSILNAIFNNLKDNGMIVLYQLYDNDESIKSNIENIANKLGKRVYVSRYLHARINSILGVNLIASIVIQCIKKLRKGFQPNKVIVFY